jgi:hypothetical protein
MATFEKHCRDSIALFGKPYEKVHRWLDEFHGKEPYGMRHRCLRHHEAGIGQAVALFGPEAEAVARRHIVTRLLQKPRMPQIQGVKGEAVPRYCEPLRTQEMRYHTAFPKGKKQGNFYRNKTPLWENSRLTSFSF